MKVICNRGALLDAVSLTGTVANPRSPKPALGCIKLTAGEDRLTLAATDLEVAIRYSDTQVQVEQPGETLIPVDKLRDIIRESTDDTLALSLEGDQVHIKGHDSHFKIFTQNPADFPAVPDFEGEPDLQIAGGTLKQLISQTSFAAAKEGTRYAFNGVLAAIKNKRAQFVGTDGRRLALARGDVVSVGKQAESATAIVPAKAMSLVDKLVGNPEDPIAVQIRENQIIFHTAFATLTSSLVDGQFAPYEDVIPKECDRKMTASTADFLSAVKRASLLTSDDSKGIRMTFSKKGLVLSSRNPEAGEAKVDFPCKYEGGDLEVGFNPHFLIEGLRVVNSDEVTLELSAANRPGLLKGGPDFLYVIMPVNLQ